VQTSQLLERLEQGCGLIVCGSLLSPGKWTPAEDVHMCFDE
jgi:hypothetical protein